MSYPNPIRSTGFQMACHSTDIPQAARLRRERIRPQNGRPAAGRRQAPRWSQQATGSGRIGRSESAYRENRPLEFGRSTGGVPGRRHECRIQIQFESSVPDFKAAVPAPTVPPLYLEAVHPGHRRTLARLKNASMTIARAGDPALKNAWMRARSPSSSISTSPPGRFLVNPTSPRREA